MRFRVLPGFRDFYPEDMEKRRYIESAWHSAARAAGFEEFESQPLEPLELLTAKSGEAIVEELFEFEDKGGRAVALRPELTPSLARMVGQRAASLPKPIRWYSIPQLFRYQRQQRGRLREHIQWNVDLIGASELAADVEVLSVGLDALRRLGLTDEHVRVRVSHKHLMESKLAELECGDTEKTLRLIDKGALSVETAADVLSEENARELLRWLDEPADPDGELAEFLSICGDYGLERYIEIDKRIVRGLAYYTGVVYEIFDRERELRAVAGGGRYDTLIEKLGGPALPAIGFGMGDVVLGELLEMHELLPEFPPRAEGLVVPLGEEMVGPARGVVRSMRESGLRLEMPLGPLKMTRAFKLAEKNRTRYLVLVGPAEWAHRKVIVKDLQTGKEREVEIR